MEKLFHLDVLIPEKNKFSGEVSSLIVPAQFGYLGVLANHAPLMAKLVPGKITTRDASGKTSTMQIYSNGFLQVVENNATLLLEKA